MALQYKYLAVITLTPRVHLTPLLMEWLDVVKIQIYNVKQQYYLWSIFANSESIQVLDKISTS